MKHIVHDANPGPELTDGDLQSMIEVYVMELGRRDFRRTRQLLTRMAIEMIDARLEERGVYLKHG